MNSPESRKSYNASKRERESETEVFVCVCVCVCVREKERERVRGVSNMSYKREERKKVDTD